MRISEAAFVPSYFKPVESKIKFDKNVPFMDLLDLVKTQQEQAVPDTGTEIDTSGIGRITFEDKEFYQFYPTGSADMDYLLELGYKYTNSCCDYTNWSDFYELTENADYTGMTDTEKYLAIYGKYQHCCGENFLDATAVGFPRPDCSDDSEHMIKARFDKEMAEAFGSLAKAASVRCEALYGTTDKQEVRQAIIDKYIDEENKISLGNFYKMANEMYECGVGEDIMRWLDDSMTWVIANEQGVDNVWEYNDYMKNYTVGVNDPYTIKYNRLDNNVDSDFIDKLKYFAYTGSGRFGSVLDQILNSVNVETGSARSGYRGAVPRDMIDKMRSKLRI